MITRLLTSLAASIAFFASPALADTLVDNVQGITINADGKVERFVALWVDDDGRIAQVLKRGDEKPVTDYRYDGQGRYLIPGLIDSHLHVMGIGFGALTLDLSDTNSLEEAQAKIAEYAAANPGRRWILGRGWNQEKWGLGRFPTAEELDAVVADRPVWLERVDSHAGWANSAAMRLAGVNSSSVSPTGGRIERVAGGNAPSGIFVDNAAQLVQAAVPAPRPEDRDLALSKAQDILLSFGITAAADMGTTIEDWQSFRRAGDGGWLKMRIMSYAAGVEAMELIGGPGPSPWLYDDKLRLNGVKLYLDGALGSRGAWLKEPYADDPGNTGLPLQTSTQLRNLMSRAALDKFQLAIHAIGDAANGEVLNAINDMSDTYDGDRRWRIEHAQVVDMVDIGKFADHGIIASMQPVHQISDRVMAEARLDPARLEGAYAWRTILEIGAPLAFGSDAPVESPDPFANIAAAISRTGPDGQPFGGWRPKDAVSREQALAGFTSAGAYAGFAEGRFGRLAKGERADFVFIDRDPMLSSPESIRETQVLGTWVGGIEVYSAD
ncbi:amidohydrolase [Pontixanthobacter aestiaquae]|uniref:Amidohydrolase family protein n=1 Tax=Pontixanthobacter aestiaquae TaxID=1509367 RepID=A0A844Z6K3_9SPHN|nr:amidohydrolase [Pontixanthobacter aestiaquae]MDN3646056.1 amidohydrolase [Pontixanthobacter aestiaquae]MXO82952.1 amidohydrolase family protein [Pontixanthobacter aestiaquae]